VGVVNVLALRYICVLACAKAVGDYWCVVGIKRSQLENFVDFTIVSSSINSSKQQW
jgi:hypothetical protein